MNPSQINICDVSVHFYYRRGEKDITILFIHGLGGSRDDFSAAFNAPELREYNLIVPDLAGHGESEASDEFFYTMEEQADILDELIKNLSISDKIVIVPHSMGGPIAVSLAEKIEEKAIGMVYAEGNLNEEDCFLSQKIIEKYSIEEWRDTGFKKLVEKFSQNPDLREYAVSFNKSGPVTLYRSSEELYKVSVQDTLLSRILELDIPVVGIFGEENKGRFSSETMLSKHFPIKYVPDAGHYMMNDNPAAFYQLVGYFIMQLY
jgi:pimeloyl-ACP methyl ester carboxylesterase